jgi:hypothetical protein
MKLSSFSINKRFFTSAFYSQDHKMQRMPELMDLNESYFTY